VNPLMLENGWTFDSDFLPRRAMTFITTIFSTSSICALTRTTPGALPCRFCGTKKSDHRQQ
jgi:hypothetical protein